MKFDVKSRGVVYIKSRQSSEGSQHRAFFTILESPLAASRDFSVGETYMLYFHALYPCCSYYGIYRERGEKFKTKPGGIYVNISPFQ